MVGWGLGVIAVGLLVWVIIAGTLNAPQGGIPEGTEEFEVTDASHVQGQIYEPNEVPPGGPHSPIWANCGFYDEPIAPENAVHSLEHGAAWITYRPDLAANETEALRDLSARKVLISPVEGQVSPIMATAWGYQLSLDNTDDPRLSQFIAEFAGSFNAPEPGAACSGGVGVPVG